MSSLKLNITLIIGIMLVTLAVVHGKQGNNQQKVTPWQPSEEKPVEMVIRRMVYHQITNWTKGTKIDRNPHLTKDGDRIIFSEQGKPSNVFVMNIDGSGKKEVDTFRTGGRVETDISADGNRFVSTDSRALHVTDVNEFSGRERIAFNSDQIADVSLSGNGDFVYFLLKSDSTLKGTKKVLKRGLYKLNPDGSNLTELVSAEDVAKRLGIDNDQVKMFSGSGAGLDASYLGDQIVFVVTTIKNSDVSKREWVFTVRNDGKDLQLITQSAATVYSVGISGDGNTVAYVIADYEGPIKGGVAKFTGEDSQVFLTDPPYPFADPFSRIEPSQLNHDGSKVLFGGSSILVDTVEKSVLQLNTGCAEDQSFTKAFCCVSMNNDANRFLFIMTQEDRTTQLGLLEFNPERYAPAPIIVNPKVSPAKISSAGGKLGIIEAHVDAYWQPVEVSGCVYHEGVVDPHTGISLGLFDDGKTRGDKEAGDGVFTNNTLRASQGAITGSRTIRIKAETTDKEKRKHATVIEYGYIEVID